MALVAVLSRNTSVAFALAATEHEVIDLRPGTWTTWVGGADAADAVVIGLDHPADALDAVTALRESGQSIPVLMLTGSAPGWNSISSNALDGVTLLALPFTRPGLIDSVEALVEGRPPETEPPAESEDATPQPPVVLPEPARDQEAVDDRLADEPVVVESPGKPGKVRPPRGDAFSAVSRRLAGRAGGRRTEHIDPQPTAAAPPEVAPPPPPVAPPPPPPPPVAPAPVQPTAPPEPASTRVPAARRALPVNSVSRLMETVGESVPSLIAVPDAADAIIANAVGRLAVDAGALLLPDDAVWRVSGGYALRPLEWRCQLDADSWLAQVVAVDGRGVVVENTDIVRQRLAGAPLANRSHIVAAPVPNVGGILLMARNDRPFSDDELSTLADVGRAAIASLTDALATRAVARAMLPLTDFPD